MRIFLVTLKLDLETGGGSNSDLDLKARAFAELGNDVTVVTAYSRSNKIPHKLPYRLVEEYLPFRGLLGIQWGVFQLFRKYQSQADVYYFDGHNFLYGAGLYRIAGGNVPVVSFFNRELVSWADNAQRFIDTPEKSLLGNLKARIRFLLEKYIGMPIASSIDVHTFTSPAYQARYQAFGLKMHKEALIVGDLFDSELAIREHHVIEEVLPEREKRGKPLTLLFSGRLVSMRGVDLLIKALSELPHKEDVRLIVCGAGPEEKALKALAKKLGVATCIQFEGWVDRATIYEWLRKVDIFVIPKGNGATSVALLEGMAFGLPSIVPRDNALEWVAGDAALTFTENEYHDLAKQLGRLVHDAKLRRTLTDNCFTRLSELDYRKTVRRIETMMQDITRLPKKSRAS